MLVSAKGASLFYSVRGEGPACVMPCTMGVRVHEALTEQLAGHFRLIFVDLRGSGRSTGHPQDLDFETLAEDLEAVREAEGLERVAVLGYSIHGVLAIEYGRRRPQAVSHVIAAGTPPRGDMSWLAAESARFFAEDASDERKRLLQENLARLGEAHSPVDAVVAQAPMRFFDPRTEAAALLGAADGRFDLLQHILGPLTSTWDVTSGAESLRVPLLLAHGRYDYVVPHRLWGEALPALPGATLHLFERSGHQPFFEEPDEFAKVVTEWMHGRVRE